MPVVYNLAGSAICTGNANPARTATYPAGASQQAQIDAFFAGDPDLSVDTSGPALLARIPTAGTTIPPGVSDSGVLGPDATKFARDMHTHASKARKQIITMGSAATTYAWTYPTAFGSGIVPVCGAIVQVPNGTTDLYNVQVMGAPTNTGCVFQINRVSSGLLALLTGALSLNPTPIAATLHMIALEP